VSANSIPQPTGPVVASGIGSCLVDGLSPVTKQLVATFSQEDLPEELEMVASLAMELINAHELLDGLGIPREDHYGLCTLAERIAWVADLRPVLSEASLLVANAAD
jgi:hypothetical protein